LPPLVIGVMGGAALSVIRMLIPPTTWFSFITNGVLYLAVVAPASWVIGLTPEDRSTILAMSVDRVRLKLAK